MLCAKYDYKMDIAVKQEEAYKDGLKEGANQGAQQKAIDTAINLLKMNKFYPEEIAQGTRLPLEKVLEIQKTIQ